MYDHGNQLRITFGTDASNNLQYTECGAEQNAGIGDVTYSTCWRNRCACSPFTSRDNERTVILQAPECRFFTAVFRSQSGNITRFQINGDLGADGGGTVSGGPLRATGSTFQAFYKTVHDGEDQDPTVNHLVFVRNGGQGWNQSFPTNTNNDLNTFNGPGVDLIVYVMYGGLSEDGSQTSTDFQYLQRLVDDECLSPSGTVCVCNGAAPSGCPNQTSAYSVQGPTFGVRPTANVNSQVSVSDLIRPDPSALGLSVICIPGHHLDPIGDKAILVDADSTCGLANATAAGGVYLSCNAGSSVCGSNDENMLACGGMPNGYVSSSNIQLQSSVLILDTHSISGFCPVQPRQPCRCAWQ